MDGELMDTDVGNHPYYLIAQREISETCFLIGRAMLRLTDVTV